MDASEEIVPRLKQLLASTYLLYIQTQGAHWNILGSDFPQMHTLFGTQYQELAIAIDVIAEHIRTYGSIAPGSAAEFIELAGFGETTFSELANAGRLDSAALLSMLIGQHRIVIQIASRLEQITTTELHTQNLAADRVAAHQKMVWMLTSSLPGRNSKH